MKSVKDIPVEALPLCAEKELLELNSVLGDYLGLGIVWGLWDTYNETIFSMGIINLRDKIDCQWWYGCSLMTCFEKMMEDLGLGIVLNVCLPRFRSVSELRMKLELLGK